jgi:hypothetical protein
MESDRRARDRARPFFRTIECQDMHIPAAIDKLAGFFHQDWDIMYDSFEDIIAASVRSLTSLERQAAVEFFDELLNGKYTEDELADIWNNKIPGAAGGFDIYSGASWFFEKIRTQLISSQKMEGP